MTEIQPASLLSKSKQAYGACYDAHLFEQYKMLVDSAQQVSDRRSIANNYLLTVNSGLLTLFGVVSALTCPRGVYAVIPVAGVLVSVTWAILISSYRSLNSAKFDVIHEFERLLPAAVFRYEWHVATTKGYKPLSHVEIWIPYIFLVVHIALASYAVFWLQCPPIAGHA